MFDPPKGTWQILPAWQAFALSRSGSSSSSGSAKSPSASGAASSSTPPKPKIAHFDTPDRQDLENFLRRFLFDYRIMNHLREALSLVDPVSRLTDHEVVETVAAKLASRELIMKVNPVPKSDTSPPGSTPSSGQGAPSDSDSAPSAASGSSDDEGPNTFGSDNDAQSQAQALADAASQGTPFCQQCNSPAPAPGVTPPSPPVPGNLKVTVLDAKTSKPLPGATVDITGPSPSSGNAADANGVVQKNGINPGGYTASAKNSHYTTETGNATVNSGQTATLVIKLRPITVTIKLGQPVACPGHPLDITAVGDPAGGTYAWTITATAADLVDGSGNSTRTGAAVNLRGFKPDDSTGNIPAQTAAITVTYTYTNGETATAKQAVTIHKIEFTVTNDGITAGTIGPQETAGGVTIGPSAGNREIVTDPQVKIQLDVCPRKAACAANHRVGWLQTMQSSDLRIRYRDSLLTWGLVPPAPIRDAFQTATFPFYSAFHAFAGDNDTQTAHHEDSPNLPAGWTDPRPGAPTPPPAVNGQLRQMFFNDTFTAWLVVQNVEWSAHDMNTSFAFLRNFDWSSHLDIAVDTTKAVGSRCTPASANVVAPANPSTGKGGKSPNLANPIANTSFKLTTAAASPPV